MIDRYLIHYLLAVIDQGNFSKAAIHCSVSQPTLSAGIAKLERLLGVPLFHRTSKRVELTEAGARFAVHARKIEGEFNIAERSVSAAPSQRALRLGILTTLPTPLIEEIILQALAVDPEEPLELFEGRARDLLDALGRKRIDAALTIVRADDHRYEGEALLTEGYALALGEDHPMAKEAVIPAEALADNVMIVRRHCEALAETSRHFTSRGVRPFFSARTTNDDRALAMVRAGLGVTVMPASFAMPGVVRPRLADFDLKREIGFVYGESLDRDVQRTNQKLKAIRRIVEEPTTR